MQSISVVTVTKLHRLNENFIIKRKIQKHFKSSHQRRIQYPVKAEDGDSFENSQAISDELFSQKAPPQMPN